MEQSAKRGVLVSALSVAVAIMLLGYSAFGWFTLARQARATGLNVKVTAPSNLQISKDGTNFFNTVDIQLKDIVANMPANTEFDIDSDKFFLSPASSFNGLNMWYTESANINGSASCDADDYSRDNSYPNTVSFNSSEKAYEGRYIDVDLWFRNSAASANDVYLLKNYTDIISSDSADVVKVARAAFLNADASAVSYNGNTGFEDALVYEKPGLEHTTTNVVTLNGTKSSLITPKYITFGDSLSDQVIFKMEKSNPTDVYFTKKITVRLWIEGEDNKCVGQIGGMSFSLNLGFGLKEIS